MNDNEYNELIDLIADGVYLMDLNRSITYWSKAAERLTGFAAEEVLGRSCADNLLRHVDIDGTNLCEQGCPMAATMLDGQMREADVFLHHRFGHRVPVHVRTMPLATVQGEIIGAVEVFTDNNKNLNLLGQISSVNTEILTDSRTGLGNRCFADAVMRNLERMQDECGVAYGVVFVGVDHPDRPLSADATLQDLLVSMVGKTISAGLRPLDVACHWGGNEFVVLVPNTDVPSLRFMMERLRVLVQGAWLDHAGTRLSVAPSLGAAVSHRGESSLSILKRADMQMGMSREQGGNRCCIEG